MTYYMVERRARILYGASQALVMLGRNRAWCVEAGARALWVFEQKVSMDALDVDARVFAVQVYARVEETMVSEINQAVDADLQIFLSAMCCMGVPSRTMSRGQPTACADNNTTWGS